MNEVEVIKGAREILSDPNRWHKGDYTDGQGRCCILGAMGMVAEGDYHAFSYSSDLAYRASELVAQHVFLVGSETLAIFNDSPSTTHQDVLNVLDKTLADLGGLA